jgi:hypothetical protein
VSMKRAACTRDGNPQKKSRCAVVAEISQPAKKTDCDGWRKLVGL